MTRVKENSTIQLHKETVLRKCPITYVMDKIGGHWKPIILFQLLQGGKRYSELKQAIPAITEKMLIQNLKQLEADQLVTRKARPVVPPHVTYSLTPSGAALKHVLYEVASWAVADRKKSARPLNNNLADFPLRKRKKTN